MIVTLYPFFSQQDKRTGRFRLDSDSGVKLYAYMAGRLAQQHDVRFVLPAEDQCVEDMDLPFSVRALRIPYKLAASNLDRRLQWEPSWLRSLECDLILTQHEFLAYPLRCLLPDQRIVMECGIRPTTAWPQTAALFPMAWRSADLVHCNSTTLAEEVAPYAKTAVWRFGYHDKVAVARGLARDVDVLFNSRCSATGYSNHEAFLEAVAGCPWNVCVTDPTNYLNIHAPLGPEEYRSLLHRSRVVVGLTDNGYGGYAFVEAVAAGACPVALRTREYEELLTPGWPYYCTLDSVADAVTRALSLGWAGVSTKVVRRVNSNVATCSYSSAWERARKDLEAL